MATILRGRHKDVVVSIHQFANDWFTVDNEDEGIMGVVVSPTNLRLDAAEMERVVQAEVDGQTGAMFREYDLDHHTGRFTKLSPRSRRR